MKVNNMIQMLNNCKVVNDNPELRYIKQFIHNYDVDYFVLTTESWNVDWEELTYQHTNIFQLLCNNEVYDEH